MVNKILLCFGTRPEWLKIKSLVRELPKEKYALLFTGQHTDLLKDVEVDYRISINEGVNRLDDVVSSCLLQFPEGDFDSVLVQGDTASAFACALAAFNRQLKIIYLEAGLRSYSLQHPYPEEAYRQMISRIADVNLCPTSKSALNLTYEEVQGNVIVVGNSVLDNLLGYKNKIEYTNKILVTLHRRENHELMDKWFVELDRLATDNPDLEFILPLHPNPAVQKHRQLLKNVVVIDPLPHNELLDILVKSKFVISDSGGLQEEGSFFNKKVIVCRETTERPEGIDTGHLLLCPTPKELSKKFNSVFNNYEIDSECPYGDGFTGQKVAQLICEGKI